MAKINWSKIKIAEQMRNSADIEDNQTWRYGHRQPKKQQEHLFRIELERRARRKKHVEAILKLRNRSVSSS